MTMIQFIKDYDDITELIDGPFNVPEPPLEEDDWVSEYQMAVDAIGKHLSQFGTWAEGSESQFAYSWPMGQSRGVGVVIDRGSSLGSDALEACVKALQSIDHSYQVSAPRNSLRHRYSSGAGVPTTGSATRCGNASIRMAL
jgi:hypothetical protein